MHLLVWCGWGNPTDAIPWQPPRKSRNRTTFEDDELDAKIDCIVVMARKEERNPEAGVSVIVKLCIRCEVLIAIVKNHANHCLIRWCLLLAHLKQNKWYCYSIVTGAPARFLSRKPAAGRLPSRSCEFDIFALAWLGVVRYVLMSWKGVLSLYTGHMGKRLFTGMVGTGNINNNLVS